MNGVEWNEVKWLVRLTTLIRIQFTGTPGNFGLIGVAFIYLERHTFENGRFWVLIMVSFN